MSADRNLLFGILALQMDFYGRDNLVEAMNAWGLDKEKPLGQILVERGGLREDVRPVLEALVEKHVELHGGDPERSLKSVDSTRFTIDELRPIFDEAKGRLGASPAVCLGQIPIAIANQVSQVDNLAATLIPVRLSPMHAHKEDVPSADADTCTDRPPFPASSVVGSPISPGPRFRVLRLHARGGLGEVFLAHDEELSREVALKEIQLRYADHPESRARFLLEAEVTAKLEHPGIVPVYGMGHYADGRPYYAMRFVRGDSLENAIRHFHSVEKRGDERGQRAFELRQLLRRFVDVCNAVAYAHDQGVIHRDIKPANVMLGHYGETLVVDWGLAKLYRWADAANGPGSETLRPSVGGEFAATRLGVAIGTPQYMSPEQAAGQLDLLGPASDVYGLGATLYHLLTGWSPFESGENNDVLRRVQAGVFLWPSQINSDVPAPLEAICLKAMAHRPVDRYRSATALANEIEHWLADKPVAAYREPRTVWLGRWVWRHRNKIAAAVATVMGTAFCLALAAVLLTSLDQFEQAAKVSVAGESPEERERAVKKLVAREQNLARQEKESARLKVLKVVKAVAEAANLVRRGIGLHQKGQDMEAEMSFRQAERAYTVAIALDDRLDRSVLFMYQALSLVLAGEHERAVAAADGSVTGEEGLVDDVYHAACVHALALRFVRNDAKLTNKYAARAVELLTKARDTGYCKDAAKLAHMKKDSDFDSLRSRDDYTKLVADLEKNAVKGK